MSQAGAVRPAIVPGVVWLKFCFKADDFSLQPYPRANLSMVASDEIPTDMWEYWPQFGAFWIKFG